MSQCDQVQKKTVLMHLTNTVLQVTTGPLRPSFLIVVTDHWHTEEYTHITTAFCYKRHVLTLGHMQNDSPVNGSICSDWAVLD